MSREERRIELTERVDHYRFQISALHELADQINGLTARCQGYKPIWNKIAHRLREDAKVIEKDLARAEERLHAVMVAAEAADRYQADRPKL
jgi:hypothetical protein